jgi:hypothetical protein
MKKIAALILVIAACWFAARAAYAGELQAPPRVTAGEDMTIPTSGSGSATFYLLGPASAIRRAVKLGQPIQVPRQELRDAGEYTAILRGGGQDAFATIWVMPAKPARLSFLARPSRLPVAVSNGIGGVVYTFDNFHNLILSPEPVKFALAEQNEPPINRTITTRSGVAFISLDSGRRAGPAQFTASVGDVVERRVVQQVAADPCNLHISAQRTETGIEVETAPIRDCSGNPVPDGTIVTITALAKSGKSSVDTRIKRGVAKAFLPPLQDATISVASGVVMGNEIRIGGGE